VASFQDCRPRPSRLRSGAAPDRPDPWCRTFPLSRVVSSQAPEAPRALLLAHLIPVGDLELAGAPLADLDRILQGVNLLHVLRVSETRAGNPSGNRAISYAVGFCRNACERTAGFHQPTTQPTKPTGPNISNASLKTTEARRGCPSRWHATRQALLQHLCGRALRAWPPYRAAVLKTRADRPQHFRGALSASMRGRTYLRGLACHRKSTAPALGGFRCVISSRLQLLPRWPVCLL
jgi:hypothetical protein